MSSNNSSVNYTDYASPNNTNSYPSMIGRNKLSDNSSQSYSNVSNTTEFSMSDTQEDFKNFLNNYKKKKPR